MSIIKRISSAHDRLFRKLMSDARVARDFFEHHLPEEIREQVDLTHLKLCPNSYVDEELEHRMCDVLDEIRMKP